MDSLLNQWEVEATSLLYGAIRLDSMSVELSG